MLPVIGSAIFAAYMPFCGPLTVRATMPAADAQRHLREFWEVPRDVAGEDMIYGPWGRGHAPDPDEVFVFRHVKKHGVSPGVEITDRKGIEWSVKYGDEGHVEFVLSRVLSAVGYHQPPVYYLDHFKATGQHGPRDFGGGRFRPKLK